MAGTSAMDGPHHAQATPLAHAKKAAYNTHRYPERWVRRDREPAMRIFIIGVHHQPFKRRHRSSVKLLAQGDPLHARDGSRRTGHTAALPDPVKAVPWATGFTRRLAPAVLLLIACGATVLTACTIPLPSDDKFLAPTAARTGCLPEDITLERPQIGLKHSWWIARCRGLSYFCSGDEGLRGTSCRRIQRRHDSTTPEPASEGTGHRALGRAAGHET